METPSNTSPTATDSRTTVMKSSPDSATSSPPSKPEYRASRGSTGRSKPAFAPYVKGWLAAVADDRDLIAVRRSFVDICEGDLLAGIIFSQLFYYHSPTKGGADCKLRVQREGHMWLAKSYKDWWAECRINDMTARRKIGYLKAIGLVQTGVFKFAGSPTLHIRIDFEQFELRYNLFKEGEEAEKSCSVQIEQNGMSPDSRHATRTDGDVHIAHLDPITSNRSYTKTTTHTSAESSLVVPRGEPSSSLREDPPEDPPTTFNVVAFPHLPVMGEIPGPKLPAYPRYSDGSPNYRKALSRYDAPAAALMVTLFNNFSWDDRTARSYLDARRDGILTNKSILMLVRYFRESIDIVNDISHWHPRPMKRLLQKLPDALQVVRHYAQYILPEDDDPEDIAQRHSR